MSAASMATPDDQSLDSVATSSIGFSDLEDQSLELRDGSLPSNVGNGVVGSGNRGTGNNNSAGLDVSNHNKASAAQAVATDLVHEDQAVSRSRILVSLVLVIAAAFLGVATYWFLSEDQNERMQQEFDDVAFQLAVECQQRLEIAVKTIETWSAMATVLASSGGNSNHTELGVASEESKWPFVTLPSFSSWAGGGVGGWNIQRLRQLQDDISSQTTLLTIESVTFGVIVPHNQLDSWNGYSSQLASKYVLQELNSQQSMSDSSAAHQAAVDAAAVSNITPYVWNYEADDLDTGIHDNMGNSTEKVEDRGPASEYAVSWQSTPLQPGAINYNDLASPTFQLAYQAMQESSKSSLSEIILSAPIHSDIETTPLKPYSLLLQPIFGSIVGNGKKIVGYLKAVVSWEAMLHGILPDGVAGIRVVVDSGACRTGSLISGEEDKSIAFELDGENAVMLGAGDSHANHGSDTLLFQTHLGSSPSSPSQSSTSSILSSVTEKQGCAYSIMVYSTEEFRQGYIDQRPIWYALVGVSTVVLTATVFALYNWLVQRRQQKLMDTAARSHALVDSLFPANVRDRLMRESGNFGPRRLSVPAVEFQKAVDTKPKSTKNFLLKARSKRGLTSSGTPTTVASAMDYGGGVVANEDGNNLNTPGKLDIAKIMRSKPIADLFPRCTVLFADIVGFTAWSSVRDPTQVFTLLETLYNSFDSIAKRRGVFKVETIGDCYVAATGLPEPRDDHAVVMGKFARDCMHKMLDLVHHLEVVLGPDTGDLSMRFGLHSGPVTAGVLRGAKSRFQLFGDTVNTAARIESSGMKTKIHVSKETADLIIAAGKSHWIRPRETPIHAKGKGRLQTYWLEIKPGSKDSHESFAPQDLESLDDSAGSLNITNLGVSSIVAKFERAHKENKLNEDSRRQVNYNVEVLQGMLKKVVAMRDPSYVKLAAKTNEEYVNGFRALSISSKAGDIVLDEINDTVHLPKDAEKYKRDPESVVLNEKAASQLRDFVTTIASMYRSNQFHSFEHAGHTTMSVTKLMARLVTSDTIDYNDMSYKKKAGARKLHQSTYGITSDPLTQFAVLFASLIHDVDHPGIPNSQIMLQDEGMAKNYRNRCIAEQNSVDVAWTLLMEPAYEDLRMCIYTSQAELYRFRQIVVNAVIATDFFDEELKARRLRRWEEVFPPNVKGGNRRRESISDDDANKKAALVIEYLIQASDISHTMQHWNVYVKWNKRLFMERYDAFKSGKSSSDPSTDWYQNELEFFDDYVIPLAQKLIDCEVFGAASEEGLMYATANRRGWASKGRDMVKEYSNVCRRVGAKKYKGSNHSSVRSFRSWDSSSRDMMSSFGSSSFGLSLGGD